jgi:chitin synthase
MSNAFSNQMPASRPTTNYLDVPIPTTRSPEDMDAMGGPTDEDIDRAVRELLHDADLNSITKREIRRKLEEGFGMDLATRKSSINAAIDRVLLSHA